MSSATGPVFASASARPIVPATPPPPLEGDAIERMTKRLSMTPRWENAGATFNTQPETATPKQVMDEVFKKTGYAEGRVSKYDITDTREVTIGQPYTAVRMMTNLGGRLALIKYLGKDKGWFNYVIKDDTPDGGK